MEYGRVVVLDLFDPTGSFREGFRDSGLSLSDASENRRKCIIHTRVQAAVLMSAEVEYKMVRVW